MDEFLSAAKPFIDQYHWLAVHRYWQSTDQAYAMTDYNAGMA